MFTGSKQQRYPRYLFNYTLSRRKSVSDNAEFSRTYGMGDLRSSCLITKREEMKRFFSFNNSASFLKSLCELKLFLFAWGKA